MEKLKLHSKDLTAENIGKLAALPFVVHFKTTKPLVSHFIEFPRNKATYGTSMNDKPI